MLSDASNSTGLRVSYTESLLSSIIRHVDVDGPGITELHFAAPDTPIFPTCQSYCLGPVLRLAPPAAHKMTASNTNSQTHRAVSREAETAVIALTPFLSLSLSNILHICKI